MWSNYKKWTRNKKVYDLNPILTKALQNEWRKIPLVKNELHKIAQELHKITQEPSTMEGVDALERN